MALKVRLQHPEELQLAEEERRPAPVDIVFLFPLFKLNNENQLSDLE